jgi:preprotein translocase subunit Sec61beta
VIACIAFMLNPASLWIMGNIYVPGGAALPFILLTIFYFARMADDANNINLKNIGLSFIALFLSIYCDWIGVFIGISFGLVSVFFARKNKKYLLLSCIYFLAIILSLSIMFIQFSAHAGAQKCIEILSDRFLYRTYGTDGHGISFLIRWSLDIFFTRNFPLLLLIAIALFFQKQKKVKLKLSPAIIKAILIAIAVLLIHNIVFLGWTAANDFSVVNYIIPFSILSGIMVYEAFSIKQQYALLSIFFLICISEYYYFNRPGDYDRKNHLYAQYKQLGNQIKNIANPDELIFINAEPAPQGWYYAKRNYYMVNSFNEAQMHFNSWKQDKCIYINQQNGNIIWYKRFIKK